MKIGDKIITHNMPGHDEWEGAEGVVMDVTENHSGDVMVVFSLTKLCEAMEENRYGSGTYGSGTYEPGRRCVYHKRHCKLIDGAAAALFS